MEGRTERVASDVLRAAAVVLIFVVLYSVVWLGPLHYLRPCAGYYSYAIARGLGAYNLEMLAIFLTSSFDAYEAVMLGVDQLLYFADGVVIPTSIMLLCLYVSYFVLFLSSRAGASSPLAAGLPRAAACLLACALADSYAASLAMRAWLGAPGVGVSVYSAFAIAASAYLLALLAYQLVALRRAGAPRRRGSALGRSSWCVLRNPPWDFNISHTNLTISKFFERQNGKI